MFFRTDAGKDLESEIHKQMGNQGNVMLIITSNRKDCFSDVDQLVCSVIVFNKSRILPDTFCGSESDLEKENGNPIATYIVSYIL